MEQPSSLSAEEVRKIARLSRLALSEATVAEYARQLGGILRFVERLRDVDLAGVEPMPHVGEEVNRLDEDVPGAVLERSTLMALAPDRQEPFVKVPKVLGDGSGA